MGLGRALVLTISDSAAAGKREDLSGPEAKRILVEAGFEVAAIEVLPDERAEIESRLRRASDEGFQLVVTSGGTGLSPRDVTPEATLAVIDRNVPGIADLMRMESLKNHAESGAFAGSFGNPAVDIDNQFAGKCERRARMSGGHSADSGARSRDAEAIIVGLWGVK